MVSKLVYNLFRGRNQPTYMGVIIHLLSTMDTLVRDFFPPPTRIGLQVPGDLNNVTLSCPIVGWRSRHQQPLKRVTFSPSQKDRKELPGLGIIVMCPSKCTLHTHPSFSDHSQHTTPQPTTPPTYPINNHDPLLRPYQTGFWGGYLSRRGRLTM